MAINHVTDSTGTILNRYILTDLDDSSTKNITLSFNPSADYVAGTKFSAATMNPIIDCLNITTGTLQAGDTTIRISDERIETNSILSFYTEIYNVFPINVSVSSGYVDLTFEPQLTDMAVGVKVEGTY